MHIKKGDTVTILTGKDKGKEGKVLTVLPKENKVVVEGMNQHIRHSKARSRNGKGQIVTLTLPIHASNVKRVGDAAPEKKEKKATKKKAK